MPDNSHDASNRRPADRPLRVVAFASYPVEAACTRLRLTQFTEALAGHGVHVTLCAFLGRRGYAWLYDRRRALLTAFALFFATLRRLLQLPLLLRADVVFVQREAMLIGPPVTEWLATRVLRRPMVLDLDDATYIELTSPVYGRLASLLKWRGKANWLIDHSAYVICGNDRIASHVQGRGKPAVVMPTIVDPCVFTPRPENTQNDKPVIGWIGSHSTVPFFRMIVPVLERLAAEYAFRVRVVGAGRVAVEVRGADLEVLPWSLEREVADFQSLDVGVYPLFDDEWAEGKSGLKAITYLTVGVPYVASPVGIVAGIGEPGVTHFLARTPDEWYEALARLLREPETRRAMGKAGREHAVTHYSTHAFAARIAAMLREVAGTATREAFA